MLMNTHKTYPEKLDENKLLEKRRLTVSAVIVNDGYRKDDYACKILLLGKWVRKCGLDAGDKLTVKVFENKIVIEKEKPGMVDPKFLEREQRASDRALRKKLKEMLSPDIFEDLIIKGGQIMIKT